MPSWEKRSLTVAAPMCDPISLLGTGADARPTCGHELDDPIGPRGAGPGVPYEFLSQDIRYRVYEIDYLALTLCRLPGGTLNVTSRVLDLTARQVVFHYSRDRLSA